MELEGIEPSARWVYSLAPHPCWPRQFAFRPAGCLSSIITRWPVPYAKLNDLDKSPSDGKDLGADNTPKSESENESNHGESPKRLDQEGGSVLAQYIIPLGAIQAELKFTGEQLTADDFDALGEFVEFAKKQFERKKKLEGSKNIRTLP